MASLTRQTMLRLSLKSVAHRQITVPSTAPIKASGRCLFASPLSDGGRLTDARVRLTSTHRAFQGDEVELFELTAAQDQVQGGKTRASRHGTSPSDALPLSLAGNSYYEQRYRADRRRAATPTSAAPSLAFHAGDLVVHAARSVAPEALRGAPMVDVTGVRTSFLDASERDARYLQTLDGAIRTMHLHDGAEVPALRRGDVAVSQLRLLATWLSPSSRGVEMYPVENGPEALLGRRGPLTFREEQEALSVARRLAEAYSRPRAHLWRLRPICSGDGCLLSFRLVR